MRFYGAKSRTAKVLANTLKEILKQNKQKHRLKCKQRIKHYVEPFGGAMNIMKHMIEILDHMGIHAHASDGCEDLMLLWKACQKGTFTNPGEITRERWYELKYQKTSSAERAFAGYGYSWMGIKFGGYLEGAYRIPNFLFNDLMKLGKMFKSVQFRHCDYKRAIDGLKGRCLIYCDPPYDSSSYRYGSMFEFNTKEFIKQVKKWRAQGHIVVISEIDFPLGRVIYEKDLYVTRTKHRFIDRLYLTKKTTTTTTTTKRRSSSSKLRCRRRRGRR